jgi:rubrerythrin
VKLNSIILSALLIILFASCSQQPEKGKKETISSLKTSIENELLAHAKYWEYSKIAREDSLPEIAAMFHATAVAEKAHADRQITVLLVHGENLPPFKPVFAPYNLKENLITAIDIEHYEAMEMYPAFILISEKEGFDDATESFGWALKAEIKHRDIFQLALASLEDPDIKLPKAYMVCPRCGNTMDAEHYSSPCDVCENDASKFVKVD